MKNIVETAVSEGSFKTLVTALQAAGLADTLSGTGPFTVFAPSDEAFSKIPNDKLESLLADRMELRDILTYHVVSGEMTAQEAATQTSAKTLQGGELKLNDANGLMVNDAKVVKTDIECSNGIIHVIDTVLMPS